MKYPLGGKSNFLNANAVCAGCNLIGCSFPQFSEFFQIGTMSETLKIEMAIRLKLVKTDRIGSYRLWRCLLKPERENAHLLKQNMVNLN